jgi:adenosylcobinamide kinase/adenosylcobinamide-phosphate guanylyltransferase
MSDRPPIVLVTGGARSGKSRFALARGESFGLPRVFVATAEARDERWQPGSRHRAERGRLWRTVEEPMAVSSILRRQRGGVVLIDCLTLWLANQMDDCATTNVGPAIDELVGVLSSRRSAVVVVTNEVGLGIVPESALARAFRDAAGFLNQRVAAIADELFLLVAGQALRIK